MGNAVLALFFALSLVLVDVTAALSTVGEKRLALVIGNSSYLHTRSLPNARLDAYAMEAFLKAINFEVIAHRDATYRDLRTALQQFANVSARADYIVVYFAGHGLEVAGENFLVPADARLATSSDLEYEAIKLTSVIDLIRSPRKLNLIIVDACRNNPLAEKMVLREGTGRSVRRGLARVEPKGDMLIAFAANAGTVAQDGMGANSPFVEALIANLGKPGLDVRLALGGVRDAVLIATGNTQEPVMYGALGGRTISLVEPEKTPIEILSAYSRENEAREAWETAKQSCSAGELRLFTARYGNTYFGDLGTKRIAEIEKGLICAPPTPASSNEKLIRDVQRELHRLGCFDGPINGRWGPQSLAALRSYISHTNPAGRNAEPNEAVLAELKLTKERACPLACKVDERISGGKCVKHSNSAAATLTGPSGSAVPKPVTAPRVAAGNCDSVRVACMQIRIGCLRACREKVGDRTYGSCEGCLSSFSTCMSRGSAGACQ